MTEKLYYKDAYIRKFESVVLSCEPVGDYYSVTLKETAFFPEEGGQYSDSGRLGNANVLTVTEADGVIYHRTDAPLTVGDRVEGEIDFGERYEKMQCHTAEHILSGLIHKHYGLDNKGFHLGKEDVTLDISAPLGWDELKEIERLANEAVYENIPITVLFPTPEEQRSLFYRSKIEITENLRVVKIGEYDSCACCAPHLNATGEIGIIKILDFVKLRGGIRIFMTAGRRAARIFSTMQDNLSKISRITSTPRLLCGESVEKMASELEECRYLLKNARLALFLREAENIEPTDKNLIRLYPDATQDELRALANEVVGKVGGILVLLSGEENNYKYIIASGSVDLRTEAKNINAALCGKGGGSSVMIQGGFATELKNIKSYFGF